MELYQTGSEISLRNYRTTDLDAMFRLDEACFTEEFRFDRESMREFAEERNAVVHIAEKVCGEIVGFVIAHIERVASEWRAYVVTLDRDGKMVTLCSCVLGIIGSLQLCR